MKVVIQDGKNCILRFDKDEEVFMGLSKFCQENGIQAASFSGIGACSKVELGYFNTTLKDYRRKPFMNNWEIISLIGTVAMADGKPSVHAHGSFSDNEFSSLVAGHVFELVVSVTCEITLVKFDGTLTRAKDSEFGLNLLQ